MFNFVAIADKSGGIIPQIWNENQPYFITWIDCIRTQHVWKKQDVLVLYSLTLKYIHLVLATCTPAFDLAAPVSCVSVLVNTKEFPR